MYYQNTNDFYGNGCQVAQSSEDFFGYVGDPCLYQYQQITSPIDTHHQNHPQLFYPQASAHSSYDTSFIESSYSILYDSDNCLTSPTSSTTSTSHTTSHLSTPPSNTSAGYYAAYTPNASYYTLGDTSDTYTQITSESYSNEHKTSSLINNCQFLLTDDVKFDIKMINSKENDLMDSLDNHSPTLSSNSSHMQLTNKPTESYLEMIAKAIISSNENRMQLKDIYNFIINNYSYYANHTNPKRWKNSIRHNLSRHACFVKSGKDAQGHFWHIHSSCLKLFKMGIYNGKALNDAFKQKQSSKQHQQQQQQENSLKSTTTLVTTSKRFSPY